MNGRALFHDVQNTSNELGAVSGNEEYLMWLRVCNALCRDSKCLPEKWMYAALCGNVQVLMSYVNHENNDGNWFDYLWVLCVCKQVHAQHQMLCQQLPSYYHNDLKREALDECSVFSTLNIVDSEWESRLKDFESIFQWIEENKNGFIPKQIGHSSNHNRNGDAQKEQGSVWGNLKGGIHDMFGTKKDGDEPVCGVMVCRAVPW